MGGAREARPPILMLGACFLMHLHGVAGLLAPRWHHLAPIWVQNGHLTEFGNQPFQGLLEKVMAILGCPGSLASAQLRLLTPVVVSSSFLNNTPIVAMSAMPRFGSLGCPLKHLLFFFSKLAQNRFSTRNSNSAAQTTPLWVHFGTTFEIFKNRQKL